MKKTARLVLNKLKKLKICYLKAFKASKIYRTNKSDLINKTTQDQSINIVIFSKDRPLQLLALIESLDYYALPKIKPIIIYNSSNELYGKAYSELFNSYGHLFARFYSDKEKGFKNTLTHALESITESKVAFLVDDIIFKNNLNWNDLIHFDDNVIPSIRLGTHLKYCYTVNDHQSLPPLKSIQNLKWWFWKEGEHDWNYPLSVDGNIFPRLKFLELMKKIDFKAPNTLELRLQVFKKDYVNKLGCCFSDSIILNIPANKVQEEIGNLHGTIHQTDLLDYWNKGLKIDFLHHHGIKNISCHQEVNFHLIERKP